MSARFGRAGAPSMLGLPGGELLLLRDNVGIFLGVDGKTTRKHGLPWSEPPLEMVACWPYALAILPRSLEVRVVQQGFGTPQWVVQTLQLSGMKFIAGSQVTPRERVFYVASETAIHQLLPVSITDQVGPLLASRDSWLSRDSLGRRSLDRRRSRDARAPCTISAAPSAANRTALPTASCI